MPRFATFETIQNAKYAIFKSPIPDNTKCVPMSQLFFVQHQHLFADDFGHIALDPLLLSYFSTFTKFILEHSFRVYTFATAKFLKNSKQMGLTNLGIFHNAESNEKSIKRFKRD